MIIINFKVYSELIGTRGETIAAIAATQARLAKKKVIVCPSQLDLTGYAAHIKQDEHFGFFAQHVDANAAGKFTGSVPAAQAKACGARGTLLNHAERKLSPTVLAAAVAACKAAGLETLVCADSLEEVKRVLELKPWAVAYEPPELIGSGVSVSTTKPEVLAGAVALAEAAGVPMFAGAGVSDANDVRIARKLGAKGVVLASAFVKSKAPGEFLASLLKEF
ncbi:MAG: triose-phosphate isomerase [Candidatus Micrarchaeia archaeon]